MIPTKEKYDNCLKCPMMQKIYDYDRECDVFSCTQNFRVVIDEHDFVIFKANGHNFIPSPSWCYLKHKK